MPASKPFIIAEAGVNHGGDFGAALKLADAAKQAGADAVKYQLFSSQTLWGDDRIKHLELKKGSHKSLRAYCKAIGIEFMCTPFDVESVEYLYSIGVERIKIASGCMLREDLLRAVEGTGLPVILSTGMSTLGEIEEALRFLSGDVTLLHCTSSYPCRLEDVHLRAMDSLRVFKKPVGFSDHTNGITSCIAAVARGATVIEKHLTLDRNQEGPDHKSSINTKEFKTMVLAIWEVSEALGDHEKRVQKCEENLRAAWRA